MAHKSRENYDILLFQVFDIRSLLLFLFYNFRFCFVKFLERIVFVTNFFPSVQGILKDWKKMKFQNCQIHVYL